MNRIETLEGQVKSLNSEELKAFRDWFASFDAEAWDAQIEADAAAFEMAARRDFHFAVGGNFLRRGHDGLKFLPVSRAHQFEVEFSRPSRRVGFADKIPNGFGTADEKLPTAARPQ